jgi:hypothetical protein
VKNLDAEAKRALTATNQYFRPLTPEKKNIQL